MGGLGSGDGGMWVVGSSLCHEYGGDSWEVVDIAFVGNSLAYHVSHGIEWGELRAGLVHVAAGGGGVVDVFDGGCI